MGLAQAEVFEVATFYAHFDVVKEGESPPPATTVRVCDSVTCAMMGADALLQALRQGTDPAQVRIVRAPCMGRCAAAPVAEVGHRHVEQATIGSVRAAIAGGDRNAVIPDYVGYDRYVADGGYTLLQACLDGGRSVDDLIATLSNAGLRGLGGAGFPAGRKWQFVRGYEGPRLMTVIRQTSSMVAYSA
mgnify:CR=1 FL=1